MALHELSSFEDLKMFKRDAELLRWVPEDPFDNRPDCHILAGEDNAGIDACCSVWWRETPVYDGLPAGTVGHFFARTQDSALQVLDAAISRLRNAGAKVAIGPLDGNTWRRYRFVTERGNEPLFFLEPDNPPEWPFWFTSAGFSPLANYTSSLMDRPPAPDERLTRTQKRMETEGIRIRNLDPSDFKEELKRIYAVSEVSFRENFLYSPISEEHFLAQYQKIQPLVLPELVLIAEDQDRPVGFAFAIPDLLEKQSGRPEQTAILKTLAVLPGRQCAGLGTLLAGLVREKAAALGFPRMIHALMHETNTSRNLAKDSPKVIREYTLYAKSL